MGLISRVSSRTYREIFRIKKVMSYRNNSGGMDEGILERQNNLLQDKLADSVSKLREVSIAMRNDVGDHNKYLDNMNEGFGSTQGLLSGTVNRVQWMMNSGSSNRKIMFYTIFSLVVSMFLIYYLLFTK